MRSTSVSWALCCTLLAVLALVVLSGPASAQQWNPVPGFNAGDWTKCVAGPDGEVFVVHQSGTLYRSTDNGAHWANDMPANVRTVTAILPLSGGVVFAGATLIGTDGDPPAVFVSYDAGVSWQLGSEIPGFDPVAGMVMKNDGTLFAVTRSGSVWSSTDNGSSWVQPSTLPSGSPNPLPVVHDVMIDANGTIFAANDNDLYTSSDGSSWSGLGLGTPVLHLATNSSGTADYFSTANATYQYSPPDNLPIPGAPGGDLGWLSNGSLLIDGHHAYDGASVNSTPAQVPGTVNDATLISGTTVMVATSQGIFVSSDDLSSFGDAASPGGFPITMLGALGSSGALVSDGDVAYASSSAGDPMHRTILTGSNLPFAAVATAVGGFAVARNAGLFRSDDGGLTWAFMNDFGMPVQALVRGSSGLVLVGTDGSSGDPLFASGDDGSSWQQVDPGTFTGDQVTALASSGTTYFAGALDGLLTAILLVSTDGSATTWSQATATLPARIDRLTAVSSTELYALCAGTLLKTNDAGASWNPVRTGVTSVAADGAGHVWATMSSSPYVMISIDHGASWLPADGGTSGAIGSLVVAPSQELYAAGSTGGYRSAPTSCITPGLVATWPAQLNPNDASGNYHNGVLQNGVTYTAGEVGLAFSLDGANDNVSVPDSPAFSFSHAIGIAGWIKTTAGVDRYIATKHEDSFYFAVGGGAVAPHKLSFWLNGVSSSWFAGSTSVDDGQWHHVAATYDGSTMRVYVDGHLDGSAARTGTIQAGGSAILIGARSDGSNASNFPGEIDELAIYNRALGSAEVQALAAQNAPCAAVGVDGGPAAAGPLRLSPPWPNPASGPMSFEFRTPSLAVARAEILDIAGRRVSRPLQDQLLPGGTHRFEWDGRDASGARVAPGVYMIRLTSGTAAAVQRIVLVR